MGFFDWAAPWVRRYGDRFTADDAATIAGWLRPAVAEGGQVLVLELDRRPFAMRLIALGERLVGEPATFMTPEELCAFMAAHGIEGECAPLAKASYRFLGRVSKRAE